MSRQRLVVVGNGMAGCRAVEEILKRDPDRYEVAIFGAEPRVNYNRIMLSPVLAGEKAFEDIVLNDEAWYRDNGITLHAGRAVTAIDRERKAVLAEGGLEVGYVRLVWAAGIRPNAALARAAGLEVGRGVVVDDAMRTSDPSIFAIGECAEH